MPGVKKILNTRLKTQEAVQLMSYECVVFYKIFSALINLQIGTFVRAIRYKSSFRCASPWAFHCYPVALRL